MVSSVTAVEALSRLTAGDRDAVVRFRDAVRDRFGDRIRDLRLFGSKVRGDDHEESDIDILVLVQDLDGRTHAAIHELATAISPWIMCTVRDFDGYHEPISRASGFYQDMRRESVRL